MSEETTNPTPERVPKTESAPDPKSAATEPAKSPIIKPGRWRRRLIRIGITVIAIGLILRASLGLVLPWAINKAAAQYNLACTYDHMDLYLLDGDVGLWHLVVAPKDGGAPFLQAEYCRGDVSTWQLLHGKLVVQQVVADGAQINLERKADGTIPLLDRLAISANKTKTAATTPSGKIDLSSPLQIDALRLQHVSAHIRDLAVTPAVDARFDMDLRLSDLGSPSRPARLWMEASSSPLLDVLRVEGEGTSQNQKIDAQLHFFLRGLHAKPAAGYLLPLGIKPVADSLSVLADMHVKLSPAANPSAFAGDVGIEKIMVSADDHAAVAVDRIGVDASSVGQGKTLLGKFSIDGVRINAERTPANGLRLAGFELVSAPPSQGKPTPAAVTATPAPPPTPWTLQIPISLGEFSVTGVTLSMRDLGVSPETNLHVDVPAFSIKDLDTDSTNAKPAIVNGSLLVTGVLRSAQVSGTVSPFTPNKTAKLQITVHGIHPEALRQYMDALGVQSELKDASMTCAVDAALSAGPDGVLTANAKVSGFHFRDTASLLDLDQVSIVGLSIDPALTHIAVDDFEIVGPTVAARRDADGVLTALGLRVDPRKLMHPVPAPAPTSSASAAAVSPPTPPATPIRLPRVDLKHFAWKGVQVQLDDAAVQPPTSVAVSDAGIDLTDFHIDPQSKVASGSPGKIRASLKAPGVAGSMLLTGTLTPVPSGMSADLEVTGQEIRTAIAAPYLRGLGIEPVLQNGSLHLLARFDVHSTEHGLHGSGSVSNFKLAEGDQELVSVGLASLKGIDLAPRKLSIDSVEVEKPRIGIEREASGTFRAAGLRLLPPAKGEATNPPASVAVASTQPAAPAEAAVVVANPPPVFSLKHLGVTDAALIWSDHAMRPAVEASGSANVTLDQFTFAAKAAPAKLTVTARAEGILDQATVGGSVSVEPTSAGAKLDITANGIRQGALAAYLPSGVSVNLKDGRFHTGIDAIVSENSQGGAAGHLIVKGFDYRDGESGPPLLAFDGAHVVASRVDIPNQTIAFDEISLNGLETGLVKAAGGETRLLGISLTQPAAPTTAPAVADEPTTPSSTPAAVAGPTTQPVLTAAQILAAHRKPLPLVTLHKLDVNVKKISVTDLTRPRAAPLTLTDVRFNNRAPIKVLGKDPTASAPIALRLAGAAAPEIGGFKADIDLTPFAPQPTLQLDLTADKINGDGLLALVPELKSKVDGSHLTEGHLHAHLEGQAKVFRRSPIDVDLSHPFDIEFVLKDLQYRDGAAGPLFGGLEEVRSDGIHIDPAAKLVQVRSLEITKPSAVAYRDAEGVHAFGLLVRLPAAAGTAAPQTQPATATVATTQDSTAVATTQPSSPSAGELQITRFQVNGLDFRYEDRAVSPVAIVPVTGLDLEVRDLTSKALEEDKPIRFSLLVNSGKVSLPKHQMQGAISGAMADLKSLSAGKQVATAPEMEERDLFAQLDASGKVSLYPQPTGWVKSSMSGLELGEFRGIAKTLGIDLDGGTLDYPLDVRLPGDGTMIVRTHLVFSDLAVAEPDDGPIKRYLKLPMPLNIGLAAIRDPERAVTIPLDVTIAKGKISPGEINNAVGGAIGSIIITAVASAPVKAASAAVDTVTDVVSAFTPLGFLFKKPPPETPLVIAFTPGDTAISGAELADIAMKVEKLRHDDKLTLTIRHELSQGDIARAAILANPSPDDARRLAAQLRARRGELLQLRANLIGQGRVALASAAPGGGEASIGRLRAVERELAGVEDGLDQMYELLRPGADRLAVRRTRQVALQIAQARLEAISSAVLNSGVPGIEKRLTVNHPQFTPTDSPAGGKATLLIVKKK